MLKAVYEVSVRTYPDEAGKDTNVVVEQLEIHNPEGAIRVLPDVTPKEDGDASLDQLDNSRLQIVNLGIHVWWNGQSLLSRHRKSWKRFHSQSTGRPPQTFPSLSTV